jgi:uridine kinase
MTLKIRTDPALPYEVTQVLIDERFHEYGMIRSDLNLRTTLANQRFEEQVLRSSFETTIASMDTMYTIGLCGVSGSGKTTIARALKAKLGATVLRQDDYFHLPPIRSDYKHFGKDLELPENTDWEKLKQVIRDLQTTGRADGQKVDWDAERNLPEPIEAQQVLVVEGFLLFWDVELRAMLDLAIYLDISDSIGMERRFARNGSDVHREWYETVTYPLYAARRSLFEASADCVIDATRSTEEIVNEIIEHVLQDESASLH